jgi:hypothetical protein
MMEREDVINEIRSFVRGNEFKSIFETQYREVLRPQVYGCSISFAESGTGSVGKWTWGYTNYDFGDFHRGSDDEIVIPAGLSGNYLVMANAVSTGGTATQFDIDLVIERGGLGASSFGSSGTPLDWSTIKFVELNQGDAVYLSGGSVSGSWTSPVTHNQLTIIRIPFGV